MQTYRCSSCGRTIEAAPSCPHCGTEQGRWADDLARIERSIAEMKARDVAIAKEQRQIAAKMQAALFQRDILSHANSERLKQSNKPRRVLRRQADRRPPTAGPEIPLRVPRQTGARTGSTLPPPPPDDRPTTGLPDGEPPVRPEASSRQVQNIMLGLGALLLGVAAVVFAAMAISSLGDLSRLAILILATGVMLATAPQLARRGLTSTAETVAVVGLLLVALNGYALWSIDQGLASGLSGWHFASLTFLVTTVIAAGYAVVSGLAAPRYATVLAAQPILPLLAYDWISGAAGWSVLLTVVAVMDLYLGRLLTAPTGPVESTDRPAADRPAPDPLDDLEIDPVDAEELLLAETDRRQPRRPESSPEEADEILRVGPARRLESAEPAPQPAPGLRELTGVLHGLAVLLALGYAVAALLVAQTVPAAGLAALALLLAAVAGLAGAVAVRQPALIDLAAGIATLAVIGAGGRIAAVALPGQALVLIAAVIALTGVAVRALPALVRRGPELASAIALIVMGLVVAGGALRAAVAPVQAATPVWAADLTAYPGRLAQAAGPAGWQLAATTFLLTVAAVLALPSRWRREGAVIGAALTALAVPASFGLAWWLAPWPPVLAAVGIAVAGITAATTRTALPHLVAALAVGLVGAGAAAARPELTAAVLGALAVAGAAIAMTRIPASAIVGMVGAPRRAGADRATRAGAYDEPGWDADHGRVPTRMVGRPVPEWAAGGAAFAFPGAVAAAVAAMLPAGPTPTAATLRAATEPILVASFLAVCAVLVYAAITQVAQRRIGLPLPLGSGCGAIAVAAAAVGAPGGTLADAWVGGLLALAAILLFLAPTIDANRRADRLLDGSDFAAAAAIAALLGTLTRVAVILAPGSALVAAALLVLLVAVAIRAMPEHWRRGPVLGVALAGGVIALIAGYPALRGGVEVLLTSGQLWAADLETWSVSTSEGAWQAPAALVLLAVAAAILLPRPWGYDAAAVCAGLATVGLPAALGLAWWSPIVVGGLVAVGYGMAAVAADDPRATGSRTAVAAAVALHAVGASLVRPWTTAMALGLVTVAGVVVAVLSRLTEPDSDELPTHLGQLGGVATGAALLAFPGAVAALAAQLSNSAEMVLTGALAASSLSVAGLALARPRIPQYLPYASVGVAGAATVTALAALAADQPWGSYAAGAVLLGVLAELIRAVTEPPGIGAEAIRRWSVRQWTVDRRSTRWGGAAPSPSPDRPTGRWRAGDWPGRRWSVRPASGAFLAAAVPSLLALLAVAPALTAALITPYEVLGQIWSGPPAELLTPDPAAVNGRNVLTALLLTAAAALAGLGFSDHRPGRAIPVMLPGVALTLLIAPISLGAGWPTSTMAALMVFTVVMLGLALTQPPAESDQARSLRITRAVVFGIGLAAGGAGLAGSLATRELTLFTLAGAVAVGSVAALGGRGQAARILGWLFASIMAQLCVLTAGLVAGLDPVWSAFGVLAVGAVLLVLSATLPRLRLPEATREASTVEWSGYAAALIAAALAYDSPRHIAALLAAWGAVLGIAAVRPGRRAVERRVLFWAAVGCEISAWWLLMRIAEVALPEAYTLPFAALALLVGVLELRHRPDLNSWVAYGPALLAAFLPTLVIVLATDAGVLREALLLLGAVATLILGSLRRQQAPVIVGAAVTAIAALHALFNFGSWLILIPIGIVLLILGASNEQRRRDAQERLRGALRGMR